ncbi:hypothetical protein A2U01_0099618, partial [Trifolium medium]|nr:hypothetical protein [Trifolium medium]
QNEPWQAQKHLELNWANSAFRRLAPRRVAPRAPRPCLRRFKLCLMRAAPSQARLHLAQALFTG